MNPNNVEIGAGSLWLQTPEDNDYVDVGGCRDGALNSKTKILDIEVDQIIDPWTSYIIGRELTFDITLVESGLFRNLAISLGIDPADIDTTDPNKDVFRIYGNAILSVEFIKFKYLVPQLADKTKFYRFIAMRAKVIDTPSLVFNKDKERVLKLKMKFYPDGESDPVDLTLAIEKDK